MKHDIKKVMCGGCENFKTRCTCGRFPRPVEGMTGTYIVGGDEHDTHKEQ